MLFLHAAGWMNKGVDSIVRYVRHLKDVQQLLRSSGNYFLGTPEFLVRRFADDGRMLILENHYGEIVGCIAYELIELATFDRATGEVVQRRVCRLRLLALRPMEFRGEIARLMTLEAMFRGTARSFSDNEDLPPVSGTLGVVMDANERGLRWAAGFGNDVSIHAPEDIHPFDPTVAALVEMTEGIRVRFGRGEPYRLVMAQRAALEEAAANHWDGGRGFRIGGDGPFIVYDSADPYRRAIDVAARNVIDRNPTTLRKLGMVGRRSATVWGPPYTEKMGITLGRFSTGEL